MPTLLAEQDTDIAVGPPAQLSGFKPDFISNTWAAAGRAEVSLRTVMVMVMVGEERTTSGQQSRSLIFLLEFKFTH